MFLTKAVARYIGGGLSVLHWLAFFLCSGSVLAQPVLINTTLPDAVYGVPYSANIMVGGTPIPSSVVVTGLPTGVTATHNGSGSVAFAGSTTQTGVYPLTVTATNAGGTITPTVSLTVARYSTAATAVAGGEAHSCAVVNGGVKCWGYNNIGQLGNSVFPQSNLPVQVTGLNGDVTAVAAGAGFTCAVISGGTKCWGYGTDGRLGNGSLMQSNVPVQVTGLTAGVSMVATGGAHGCAVVNGGAQCWGYNVNGQLGNGSTTQSATPVQVFAAGGGVTAVATGLLHTCSVVSGGLKCWGFNFRGQLGDGSTTQSTTPVQVTGLTAGVTAVAAGDSHSCAVVAGGVRCWGSNVYGQLGNSSFADSPLPVQVTGLTSGVTAVAVGKYHSCAVVSGGVKCWGSNIDGQLGDGGTTQSAIPVQVTGLTSGVNAVSTGFNHSCAVVGGSVECWGRNQYGQLGDGSTTQRTRAGQVLAAGSGVGAASAGAEYTCATIDGGARCWGSNGYGQLGNGSTAQSGVPVPVTGLANGVTAVATGAYHGCAVVNSGVRCWGWNLKGQLGNGTTIDALVPVQVNGLNSGVTAVAAGLYHSCAAVSGGVQCWGDNGNGQLGVGSTAQSTNPVQTIAAGSGVTSVVAGFYHSCALVSGGVKCWGYNAYGQLGNGIFTTSNLPAQVTGLTNGVTAVAASTHHGCAITVGAVQCWGYNAGGQLGNGGTTDSPLPVTVIGLTSDITAVAAGGYHSCAGSSGGVRCWGYNLWGQLGNGNTTQSATAVQAVGSGGGVTAVTAGNGHSCATINGGLQCWGDNRSGQLADAFTAPGHRAYVAIPYAYVLTVTISGSGAGAVTSSPTGVNCGATCATTHPDGTLITLTATPSDGSNFSGWSGGGCSGTGTCVVTIDATTSITATFAINQYTVSSTGSGVGGSITPPSQTVNHGSTTTFSVVPTAGYTASASGCSGSLVGTTFTTGAITGPCTVTAVFTLNQYTLTYTANANGSISGTTPQTVNHGSNGSAVTAVANGVFYFTQWSDSSTANPRTDSNVTANITVAASFAAKGVTSTTITAIAPTSSVYGQSVDVTALVTGGINPTGALTITATPNLGGTPQQCSNTLIAGAVTCTLPPLGEPGAYTLVAAYAGDTNDGASSSAAVAHQVTTIPTAVTIVSHTPDPSLIGSAVTVNVEVAAVSPPPAVGVPGGGVTVSASGTESCTVASLTAGASSSTGSCALTLTTAGARTLTVSYAGDAHFAANSNTTSHTVNLGATSTTISSVVPALTSPFGQAVTVNASVSGGIDPTGTVTISASPGAANCTATLAAGSASCALIPGNAGSYTLTATYGGDGNDAASASAGTAHMVVKAAQTLSFAAQVPTLRALVVGGSFPISPLAVPGASSSVVTYGASPSGVCTLLGTTVTMVGLGSCAITASQLGDSNYEDATPVTQPVAIVATLDVDQSVSASQYHALTDGLLIIRYLAGLTGTALTQAALGATATRTDPALIKTYLDTIRPLLDVDADSTVDANTDGVLILRYLLGLRGAALIAGVAPTAVAADVEARILALMP